MRQKMGLIPNTFSDIIERKTACDACAAGRTSAEGASTCSECAAGKIENSETKGCDKCGTGEYRGGADAATTCLKCPQGFSNPINGSGSCWPCIPGEYQNDEGQPSCKKCAVNTFSTTSFRS